MRCEEFNQWLDLLMDDELDTTQRQAMSEHARACPDCAQRLRSTLLLKDMMRAMPVEADVPLAAQARWRNAVRAEARKAGKRRFTRWASLAAAAVVLVVGVSLALPANRMPDTVRMKAATGPMPTESPAMASEEEMPEVAAKYDVLEEAAGAGEVRLAADSAGEADQSADAGEAMVSLSVTVSDLEVAKEGILDTAREYDAGAALVDIDNGAQLEASLSGEDAAELLEAVRQWDVAPDGVTLPELPGGQSVALVVYIWKE